MPRASAAAEDAKQKNSRAASISSAVFSLLSVYLKIKFDLRLEALKVIQLALVLRGGAPVVGRHGEQMRDLLAPLHLDLVPKRHLLAKRRCSSDN